MENHLGELWGLFDFLMPGFLFDQRFFNEELRSPIEKEGNTTLRQHLNDRIRPFLLRRTKQDVILELPPKTEIIHKVTLGNKQAKLYESIRVAMDKKVRDVIKEKGVKRSHIMILDALLKLRQVCCDPRLVKLEQAKTVHESTKFDALLELLEELHEEGRKILLFSQFTQMLGLIETALKEKNFAYTKLTGQTRKREEAIAKFKRGEVSIFLISLKAGGVGLNLTEADSIIHYDPWWNPAVENQATDRAYRIGQDKPVFVYKLIAENSVEEKILALQKKKQALADSVYENKDGVMGLTQEDLQELFK
jgi:SNF2 family DNA or RNA helicase